MRQAEALTPAEAWTLSNSLISDLIQNHYEHCPLELLSNAGNMFEEYCAQYGRGYPPLLTSGSRVAMVTSSTPPKPFSCNRSGDNRHPVVG